MDTVSENVLGVNLLFQGGLVKVKVRRDGSPPGGGKRGKVSAFSSASRKRLLELFNSLDLHRVFVVMITLTYPADFPSPAVAKVHRRAFEARMLREAPGCAWVWRFDFQERGAPHFHLLVFGLPFLGKEKVREWWEEIIGHDLPYGTRIEAARTKRKVMGYVSKVLAYVSKRDGGFNLLAYLHNGEFVHPVTGELCGSVGRWWGVGNSKNLPFAVQTVIEVGAGALSAFYSFRRGARRSWRGCSRRPGQGFVLFVGDARRWLDYWFAVLCTAA